MASPSDLRAAYRAAFEALSDPTDEGLKLEAAYQAVRAADDAGALEEAAEGVSLALFLRLAATDEADARWPFAEIGRRLAARGDHRHLIYQLPRVRTAAERRELLAQHRAWGDAAVARAAADPVRPAPRGARPRPRVGLVSSDLRIHAVGAFADPLIDHAEACGVELYCYSAFPGPADGFQQHAAARAAAFRHLPGADARTLAQAIATDAPDVLVEIGGSTQANRLEALAHRLAPVQMSWLGYPHSAGLPTIDYLVADPYVAPTEPDLLIEQPLVLPETWISLSPGYFRADLAVAGLPMDRRGHVTFGSAGSTYKYSAATLAAWAKVVAAVPGSRFRFVRPEGGAPTFRANVARAFAAEGVAAERLEFVAVRGRHLPHYGEIDISLDTFPLVGGMTTCEALWMGVPVVSLAGPAFYERLGHSLLNNSGLGDLSTASEAAFIARAVALASEPERLRAWRRDGRAQMMAGPLGDMERFSQAFFAAALSKL